MKKNFVHLFCFFTVTCSQVFAQNNKLSFHSLNETGIIMGAGRSAFVFQTINGFTANKWYAGIGLGMDTYQYNTLPVFLDLRKYFGTKSHLFVYGDIGYDIMLKNKPDSKLGFYHTYKFEGGLYTDVGFGYKMHLVKRTSLLLSIGQSYKQVETNIVIANNCIECTSEVYNYKFGYGRILLKAGVLF